MNFVKTLTNSLISTNENTKTSLSKGLDSFSYPTSHQAMESLFFIQAYGQLITKFPFFYEMENLDSYHIIYTLKGEGTLRLDNLLYKLPANYLAFIECSRKHSISIEESSSWHFISLFINGNSTKYYYEIFMDDLRPLMKLPTLSQLPQIFEDFSKNKSVEASKQELIHSKLIVDLLTQICLEKRQNKFLDNCIPSYIVDIKKEFDTNYQDFYSLDLLEEKYKKNKYHISREFKHYIHMSPIKYLIERRISVSKKLLSESNYSITEISSMVGIDNTNHFINLFKKKEGVTPLTYRKGHH